MDDVKDQPPGAQPPLDPEPASWSPRAVLRPAVVGGLVGIGMTLLALALDRPAGSYAVMSEGIIVVFAGLLLLVVTAFIGLLRFALPTSRRSGAAILTAAGSGLAAAVLLGFIARGGLY